MLKQTITFVDYNGTEKTREYYFNLSRAELLKMAHSVRGGLSEHIKKIIATNDNTELYNLFEDLILKSYGEISVDGERFVKTAEQTEAFAQSEAFSELITKLVANADEASAFVNGIVPKNINK